MMIWIERIMMGCNIYRAAALTLFVPAALMMMFRSGRINVVRFTLNQLFCFYLCCVFALVFLPLPTMEAAQNLSYDIQLIPFYFVYDILHTRSAGAVFCVVFNIMMTIPLGMYLRYVMGLDMKTVVKIGLAVTCFIEIAQLTGLFFLFHGSYRLCDIDDVITNTCGTWIGFLMAQDLEKVLPALSRFDLRPANVPAAHKAV